MKCSLLFLLAMSLAAQTYKVQTADSILELPSEEYVAGVIAGESSIFRGSEGLKAMAITARTYAARMRGRHAREGFDFCSTTHCQRYVRPSSRAIQAAAATAGEFLWFNGKPAFSVYSRSCGGTAESVSAIWPGIEAPYLVSHADPYCSQSWSWNGSPDQIRDALLHAGLKAPGSLRTISVLRRSSSGRAQVLSLDGELLSASAFRFAIGRSIGWHAVRSEQYQVENAGAHFVFRGKGEGHGVGLCQAGADQMGLSGKTYRQILAFYYPGASLQPQHLNWTRISGDGVVLYTLVPDSDRALIPRAGAIILRWRNRFHWPLPPSINLYVYPNLDAFRNATGEPGWVAAITHGTNIEMQPVAVLRNRQALSSTLEHEVVHCFVEFAARPGLPAWFREGLVEYLTIPPSSLSASVTGETDLNQRQNRPLAESAYRSAASRVRKLVNRYGETTVLAWVPGGLPAEVKYSSASNPAVNSK